MSGKQYLLSALKTKSCPMAAWLNIYRKTYLLNNNLYFKFGILHEDEEFTPRAFLSANSVIYTGIEYYHYVLRENSISTQNDKRQNARDTYTTCCELEKLYRKLDNIQLKKYLLNSLSCSYLDLFQVGRLYKYGKNFLHKDLVFRNAKLPRTRVKAALYILSPRLYYFINNACKKGFRHV